MFEFSNMKYHLMKQTELSRQIKNKNGGGDADFQQNVIKYLNDLRFNVLYCSY